MVSGKGKPEEMTLLKSILKHMLLKNYDTKFTSS